MKFKFLKKSILGILCIINLTSMTAFAEELKPTEINKSNITENFDTTEIAPLWTVRYVFSRYDAKYKSTADTTFYMGEYTVRNESYTQSASAVYTHVQTTSATATFTGTVSANASLKAKVVEVGTSTTYSGSLSTTVSQGLSLTTGSTVSPRKKVTISLYNKGIAVTGASIYKMYDVDNTYLGEEYRPDSASCWFPKKNAFTTVVGAETSL